MLFRTSNTSTQRMAAASPPAVIVAAVASASGAIALMPRPITILTTSLGSLKRLDQSRQKATAAIREEIDATESTVISHVVGIVRPKNTMSMLLGTQSR